MVKDGERKTTWQERLGDFVENSILWLFILTLTAGLTFILSFNPNFVAQLSVQEGQPSPALIVAPRFISFDSEILTQQAIEAATQDVQPSYTSPSLATGRAQSGLARDIFAFIDTVRADSLANPATKISYMKAIISIRIEDEVAEDLVLMSDEAYEGAKADILRIIQVVMRLQIHSDNLSEIRRAARLEASYDLAPQQERVVTNLAPQFIVANSEYDAEATEAKRQELADAVPVQKQEVLEGETIIRAGEVVDAEDIEILTELGLIRAEQNWSTSVRFFVASILAVLLITLYWQQYHPRKREVVRYWLLFGLLILVFVVLARLIILGGTLIAFLYPAAAFSLLLAIIFDKRLALIVTPILSLIVGLLADNSLQMAMYSSLGGLLAVLTLRDTERINAVFRAGLMASLGNMATILIFNLSGAQGDLELLQFLLMGLLSGIISASLTIGGFYLVGGLFGIITTIQLQDLSRLDHPLLKDLLRRAPGTYHHSIMVANLAEQAAERIKANSTLVRVGAFYHDIGKMNRPPFFSENQDGANPHDSLDPYSSARIIIGHVTDGLNLARQGRLPDRIRDFIAEHHGTKMVTVFYKKAIAQAGENGAETVDKKRFQYPGPRPRTRESAIVALADAIEAASSAVRPDTEAAIEKLINSIVEDHLKESQLDNSGLTLGDLQQLRESFGETLKGRFHVRVKYPGNEEIGPGGQPATAETPTPAPGFSPPLVAPQNGSPGSPTLHGVKE